MVSKSYSLFVLFFILASVSALAATVNFLPTSIPSGQEITNVGYKFSNHSNVVTISKIQDWCSVKPDERDDGWMDCEFIFEQESPSALIVASPSVSVDFRDENIRNLQIAYSNTYTTGTEVYYNSTVRNDTYRNVFVKRQFSNFGPLPVSINLARPSATRISFEAPKFSTNQFSYTLSKGTITIASIDPVYECGSFNSPGVYTLDQNIEADGTCFIIDSGNVTLGGAGYVVTGNGLGSGIVTTFTGLDNITVRNFGSIVNFTSGVQFDNVTNAAIFNNSIYAANATSGDTYGISITLSDAGNISSNNITTYSRGYGIFVSDSSYNILSNTIITSGVRGRGIMLGGSSAFGDISRNNISTSAGNASGIMLGGSSHALDSNVVHTGGMGAYGISFGQGNNHTATHDTITTTNSYDISVVQGNGTVTNLTFEKNEIFFDSSMGMTPGRVLVRWYVGVTVMNTTGSVLEGATVSGSNVSGIIEDSAVTDSDGRVRLTLTDFFRNNSDIIYHTPHTVTASLAGYDENSTIVNLTQTNSTAVTLVLGRTPSCGTITTNWILTANVTAEGTCFTLGADNIVLDCNGYSITYGTDGTIGDYGVRGIARANITVQNCIIQDGNSTGNSKDGIRLDSVFNSVVQNNRITTLSGGSEGIILGSSGNNIIQTNTIYTNNSGSGIILSTSNFNDVRYNNVTTTFVNANGIWLTTNSGNNTLLNNGITAINSAANEIHDDTGAAMFNSLVYNNSFGEIRWTSANFLQNLTTAVNNGWGMGLGRNLFIGNNTAALNTSAFTRGNINSSTNITLEGLPFPYVSRIRRLETYSTSSGDIISGGMNCVGLTCMILNYSNGTLLFNTTSLGSFAVDSQQDVDVHDLSLLFTNFTAYAAFRFFLSNIAPHENIFNWTFETGENTIQSTLETNLIPGEEIFVFVEHNYATPGTYTVVANGTTAGYLDREEINAEVG